MKTALSKRIEAFMKECERLLIERKAYLSEEGLSDTELLRRNEEIRDQASLNVSLEAAKRRSMH